MSTNEGLTDGLTLAEHRRMCDAATCERDRIFFRVLWLTASRLSEAIALEAGHISGELNEIKPRNLKRRKQADGSETIKFKPLSLKPSEIAEIEDYCKRNNIEGRAYLFPGRKHGTHLTDRRARTIFYNAARAAGIERVSLRTGKIGPAWPHCSRHGIATHMLRQGVGLEIVQKRLGHSQISNTLRYLQIITTDQARALESVEM